MTKEQILGILKQNRELLAQKYHVINLFLFGSYVSGQFTPKSDIDLLVDISQDDRKWGNHLALERFLVRKLHKKVDLVYMSSLNPIVREEMGRSVVHVS
ncbi:MAG: nucleotidyltransferase domain-containing protein [Candidatus Margulisiibacteriota bacterium]